jgi:hypothetical protein
LKSRQVGVAIIFGVAALSPVPRSHCQTAPVGLQISSGSVDFGEVTVNSESPPDTITLSNQTKANITVDQIIPSGIDFSEKHDCGQTLAPGEQCTIQISFKPVISGPRIGNLDVIGSDPASPHFIALTGIGK